MRKCSINSGVGVRLGNFQVLHHQIFLLFSEYQKRLDQLQTTDVIMELNIEIEIIWCYLRCLCFILYSLRLLNLKF